MPALESTETCMAFVSQGHPALRRTLTSVCWMQSPVNLPLWPCTEMDGMRVVGRGRAMPGTAQISVANGKSALQERSSPRAGVCADTFHWRQKGLQPSFFLLLALATDPGSDMPPVVKVISRVEEVLNHRLSAAFVSFRNIFSAGLRAPLVLAQEPARWIPKILSKSW